MAIGVWLVGARGSLATTVAVGVSGLAAGAADRTGLVTGQAAFAGAGLPGVDDLVLGGHDVVDVPLHKRAEQLAVAGVVPAALLPVVGRELAAIEARIRPGIGGPGGVARTSAAVDRVRRDLDAFRSGTGADPVVVINVSSTEAPVGPHPAQASWAELDAAIRRGDDILPPSSVYACAAFRAGCAFVDFTPSTGARLPALGELAEAAGVPHAGRDGKTGETLVKSVLAPMFADRNLRVRSWAGTNLLGGGDGTALRAAGPLASKVQSKGLALSSILGYEVEAPVHIQNVDDLGDWKTAWDHISFEGFLGVRMGLQFTWQGCDSALAAPLVVDLARLVAAACRAGRHGPLPELAFFFKDPQAPSSHRLADQYARLVDWATALGAGR